VQKEGEPPMQVWISRENLAEICKIAELLDWPEFPILQWDRNRIEFG
jgi:hypothetical protein